MAWYIASEALTRAQKFARAENESIRPAFAEWASASRGLNQDPRDAFRDFRRVGALHPRAGDPERFNSVDFCGSDEHIKIGTSQMTIEIITTLF